MRNGRRAASGGPTDIDTAQGATLVVAAHPGSATSKLGPYRVVIAED